MALDSNPKKREQQLEQRVRKLEDQMTILKNQIQNSLLEIQEVLATRFYHAALRPGEDDEDTDESVSPPPLRWGGHESGAGSRASTPAAQPSSWGQPDPAASPSAAPKVKKVSLDDVRRSRQEPPSPGNEGGAMDRGYSLVAFAELVNWVKTSTARVGSAYTREAIDDCQTEGVIAPQAADQLRQLIGEDPPGEVPDDVEPDEVMAVTTELRAILHRSARP